MMIKRDWLYPPSFAEAVNIQRTLAEKVVREDQLPASLQWLGGADISHNRYDPDNLIHAAMVVLNAETLTPYSFAGFSMTATLPYRPGFLGFREVPALVETYQKLIQKPDVLLVDGHGISHPRGLGIASHIGVLLDIPTIGVAKSILVGSLPGELAEASGSQVPLIWKGREIGRVLRTKRGCNPLYISTGHRISLETAVQVVLSALKNYRLPEPTRLAHNTANQYRQLSPLTTIT